MSIYVNSIRAAAFVFLFVGLMIMIPAMIVQYRKYGSISTERSIILYGFLFYLISAFCLVILPLPSRDAVHTSYREMMQLVPFTFISDFMRETVLQVSNPSTYLPALKQGVVTQVIFNIFLTIPFGMFLRYYFNKSLRQTLILSFCLSLFFELTQLSGLYFIYPGPYRLFDVDDLLLNTIGGVCGYALSPLLRVFFPSKEELDKISVLKGREVTYSRRFIAYIIDVFIINLLRDLCVSLLQSQNIEISSLLMSFIIYIIYFSANLKGRHQATLGQRLVKIKVVYSANKPWRSILLRTILMYLTFNINSVLINPLWNMIDTRDTLVLVGTLFLLFIQFFWGVFFVIHIFYTSRKGHHLFYDVLSRSHVESTLNTELDTL